MNVIKAPQPFEHGGVKVFLAGSIEMGAAENWQERLTAALEPYDVTVLNPRRDDWDSTWEQKIDNPQFNEQVTWELSALEDSDLVVFYFDPSTKSPITLLELGLFGPTAEDSETTTIVCCPEGFWRKGNVDIVCDRYDIPNVDDFDSLVLAVTAYLHAMTKNPHQKEQQ